MTKKHEILEDISVAIRQVCQGSFGVLDHNFLCKSLGLLDPKPAICAAPSTSLRQVLALLKSNKCGCIAVTEGEKLVGIFSERDVILRVDLEQPGALDQTLGKLMTKDPVTAEPETTIAYALNLMSLGGFRHIPVVSAAGDLVGVVSVKDVIDFMVEQLNQDLLQFQVK